jgi:parallel beta-helix repeat protein
MSEIDRNLKGPGNHFRGRLLATLIASAIVASLMMTMLIAPAPSEDNPPAPNVPARISYTTHAPININQDSGFTFSNSSTGIGTGSGTESDPYVISGWEIDAAGGGYAIVIQGSNVFFRITGCYLHGATNPSSGNGIWLNNVRNGTLIDNSCSGNECGIDVEYSSNITIVNCTCTNNNYFGIFLKSSFNNIIAGNDCSGNKNGLDLGYQCENNTISGNNCSFNTWDGITLAGSGNDTAFDNDCFENSQSGIHIYRVDYGETLFNNSCIKNGWNGICVDGSSSNDIIGNDCLGNWMSGILLEYYFEPCNSNVLLNNNCSNLNENGISLSPFCNYSIISNNHCDDNKIFGFYINASSYNTIENNTCNNKDRYQEDVGMLIYQDSRYNNISNNFFANNTLQGIHISTSTVTNNRIWNNTFYHNNGAVDIYDPDHVQAVDHGINNWWNTSGTPHGYGNWWSDWRAPDDNWDGIVDNPYNISGTAGANDSYPQTIPGTPIPEPPILILAGIMVLAFVMIGMTRRKL